MEYTEKREVRDLGIINIIPEIPLNVDKVTCLELKGLKRQAWGKWTGRKEVLSLFLFGPRKEICSVGLSDLDSRVGFFVGPPPPQPTARSQSPW